MRRPAQRMCRRAQSSPLDATALPVSGAFERWVADASSLSLTGSNVDTWTGKISGRVLTGTTTARPTFSASDSNFAGNGSITFDGSNDRVISADAASTWGFLHRTDMASTIFMVLRSTSTSTAQDFISTWNAGSTHNMWGVYDGTAQTIGSGYKPGAAGSVQTVSGGAGTCVRNAVNWVALYHDSTTIYCKNSAYAGTGNTVLSNTSTTDPAVTLAVGADNGGTSPFAGQIAEVVIWNSKLSDASIAQLAAYAVRRYGAAA